MSNIYDQHAAAFAQVSAYVICKDGERIASVAFKFPRDGAGRLTCYFHVFSFPMVRGHASGYGYDKRSAACESAVAKIDVPNAESSDSLTAHYHAAVAIKAALCGSSGHDWDRRIRDAGYTVWQAA